MSAARTPVLLSLLPTLALAVPVSSQAGSVAGTVHDSIDGGPLPGATVYLWETSYRGVTDEEGRFRIDDVAPGDYSVLFFHDKLGVVGVSPGPRSVTIESGREAEVELATPSMSTVVRSQCLVADRPEHTGAVAGRVLDASSGVPLGGASVTLSWPDENSTSPHTIRETTDPFGWYRSCSVPADVPVLLGGSFYDRRGERREIEVPEDGFVEAALPLHQQDASQVVGRLVDNASGNAVEGAEAWLRGTSHRALSDADGRFELPDVVAGTYMLMTDHLAYGVKMDTLVVPPSQSLSVEMRLDTRPIEMPPLTVTTEAPPVTIDRRRGGIVITRDQIDQVRQQSRDASDVIRSLHIPGVIVRHNTNGRTCVGFITGQVKMNQTGCVRMLVYINDVRATDPSVALRMPPDAIERMVVYKPVEAGNLFGLGGGNGVWMIYTRGN